VDARRARQIRERRTLSYDRLVLETGIDISRLGAGIPRKVRKKLPHAGRTDRRRTAQAPAQRLWMADDRDDRAAQSVIAAAPLRTRLDEAQLLKARATPSRASAASIRRRIFQARTVHGGWQSTTPDGRVRRREMHGGVKNVDAKPMTVKTDRGE